MSCWTGRKRSKRSVSPKSTRLSDLKDKRQQCATEDTERQDYPTRRSNYQSSRKKKSLCIICFEEESLDNMKTLCTNLLKAARVADRLDIFTLRSSNKSNMIDACKIVFVFIRAETRSKFLVNLSQLLSSKAWNHVYHLQRKKAAVYLIIYDCMEDKQMEGIFQSLQFEERNQIEDHETQLKQLEREGHVICMKNSLSSCQVHYLANNLRSHIQKDRTGGENLLNVVCFERRDLEMAKLWTNEILRHAELQEQMMTLSHVITSTAEAETLRNCSAALVFVFPDERGMILEDPRYHMAEKRRETVQSLKRKKGDVFVIIYNDKSKEDEDDSLWNGRLGQIKYFHLLQDLEKQGKVVSFNDHLNSRQLTHLANDLRHAFHRALSTVETVNEATSSADSTPKNECNANPSSEVLHAERNKKAVSRPDSTITLIHECGNPSSKVPHVKRNKEAVNPNDERTTRQSNISTAAITHLDNCSASRRVKTGSKPSSVRHAEKVKDSKTRPK